MTTIKSILDKFNIETRLNTAMEETDIGDINFDNIKPDHELLVFTSKESPDYILRIDLERRDVHLYQYIPEGEALVTRWVYQKGKVNKLQITVPRDRFGA